MKFTCFEPTTLQEGVATLTQYADRVKLLSGGTDLMVQMRRHKIAPEYILSLTQIDGLNYIRYGAEGSLNS